MKVLNEVRRDALAQLRETLLENGRREPAKKKAEKGNKKTVANEREDNLPLYVSCERTELAEALLEETGITGFYLPIDTMMK